MDVYSAILLSLIGFNEEVGDIKDESAVEAPRTPSQFEVVPVARSNATVALVSGTVPALGSRADEGDEWLFLNALLSLLVLRSTLPERGRFAAALPWRVKLPDVVGA